MTDGDIESRLQQVEAHLAIHRLVAEYCHGADKRDLARFLAVWCADAVWDVGTRKFQGRGEIRAAIEHQWAAQPRMFHWTTNLSITVGPDQGTASGESDVETVTQLADGTWLHSAGSYQDVYRQDDATWRIARRTAVVHVSRRTAGPAPVGP